MTTVRVIRAVFAIFGLWMSSATPVSGAPNLTAAASVISEHHIQHPKRDEIPTGDLTRFRAYLKTLDPYARLLTPGQYRDLRNAGGRRPIGVGAASFEQDGKLLLLPFAGGSLYASGIRSVVAVEEIDDTVVHINEVEQGRNMLRSAHRSVKLKLRDVVTNYERVLQVLLTPYRTARAELQYDGKIALIRIHDIVPNQTADEIEAFLKRIEARKTNPVSILVFDLRYSPGGDLTEAAKVADLFLGPDTSIVRTKKSDGVEHQLRATSGTKSSLSPQQIVALIGSDTASSAEILARALQSVGVTMVGRRTYGKCWAQEVFELPDGYALLLSTSHLIALDDTRCDGKGVRPDQSLGSKGNIHDTEGLLRLVAPNFPALARSSTKSAPVPQVVQPSRRRLGDLRDGATPSPSKPKPTAAYYACSKRMLVSGKGLSHHAFELNVLFGPLDARYWHLPDHGFCIGPLSSEASAGDLVKRLNGDSNRHFMISRVPG